MNWPWSKQEPCSTCAALREQLEYERAINKDMLETLVSLIKPIPIIQGPQQEPKPITPRGHLWSRRRMELERADKEAAKAKKSPLAAKPDTANTKPEEIRDGRKTVEQLEMELGVVDSEETEGVH